MTRSETMALPKVLARPFVASADGDSQVRNLLTPHDQHLLARVATVLSYRAPGTTIFTEGEDAHFLYSIDEGVVRISRLVEEGDRQVLAFMWPGDIFGLAENGRYVNSAEALTPATICRYPLDKLRNLLLDEPQLQLHLLVKAAHELRAAQRQIIVLGRHDTYRRVASFLLDLSQHAAFRGDSHGQLKLPMTRSDIADYLGTSSETVTRAFARLEREGVISRSSPRSIMIDDLAALARLPHERDQGGRPTTALGQ